MWYGLRRFVRTLALEGLPVTYIFNLSLYYNSYYLTRHFFNSLFRKENRLHTY